MKIVSIFYIIKPKIWAHTHLTKLIMKNNRAFSDYNTYMAIATL